MCGKCFCWIYVCGSFLLLSQSGQLACCSNMPGDPQLLSVQLKFLLPNNFLLLYMRECVHFVGNFSGSHYRTSALSCTYMHSHQQTGTFRGCVCAVFIAYLLHKHTFVCSVCIYVCVAASVNYGCCCLPVTIVVTLPTRSNHPVFVQLAFLLCQPLWNSGSAPKFATASASK